MPRTKQRPKLSPFQVQRMVHLYTVQKLDLDAIGWLYNRRTAGEVRDILRNAGVNFTTKKKRQPRLPQSELDRVAELFREGMSLRELAVKFGNRNENSIRQVIWRAGIRLNNGKGSGTRISDEEVARMHAEYMAGATLAEIARRFGRSGGSIGELFRRRGLQIREYKGPSQHKADGTFVAAVPLTAAEIQTMIDEATDIAIPERLRLEWRKWPLDRRADFVTRLRARLNDHLPDPKLFSRNVEFFSYGHPAAHVLMDKLNEGTNSRGFRVKINLKTWGVIYDELLWTWSPNTGGFVQGPFHPAHGRPALHRELFRKHHGAIPADHVVRFIDGNRFNLEPSNLTTLHREQVLRENQAASLTRKSRDLTALILKRSQSPSSHEQRLSDSIRAL